MIIHLFVEFFKFELTMASTSSGGGQGGNRRNSVGKGILEKRSRYDNAGKDIIRGYLGMKSYSVVF